MNKYYYESPIGILEIIEFEGKIREVDFYQGEFHNAEKCSSALLKAVNELDEYFNGERKVFTCELFIEGTEFQKKVWNALMNVPYGETSSYKDIAIEAGNEKACRAVGNSNNKNKLPIFIPCHRIIGSNGKLTGYAGGLWRKEWLLEHEKKFR